MSNLGAAPTNATLDVEYGGTGAVTLTDHGILVGSGTVAIDAITVGAAGEVLIGQAGADPDFSSDIVLGTASTTDGSVTLYAAGGANFSKFQPGAVSADITYTLPADTPAASEVLKVTSYNAGAAVLEWASDTGGSAAGAAGAIQLSDGSGNFATDTDFAYDTASGTLSIDNITAKNAAEWRSGNTDADALKIGAYDVDGTAFAPFLTLTSGDTPTLTVNGLMTFDDGINMAFDTTNGTQIGTANTQKIGFFGTTPVVQPSAYSITNAGTDRAYDADATTIDEIADTLGTLVADLQSLGILG